MLSREQKSYKDIGSESAVHKLIGAPEHIPCPFKNTSPLIINDITALILPYR